MSKKELFIGIVASEADWKDVCTIRTTVFMEEQNEPFSEQWDGNDFSGATHVIMRLNGIAIGCLRVRFLSVADGGTVIWERFAILKNYRGNKRFLFSLVKAAKKITMQKGCKRVIGIVNDPRLQEFWKRDGFQPTGEPPIYFRGKAYVPYAQILNTPKPGTIALAEAIASGSTTFSL